MTICNVVVVADRVAACVDSEVRLAGTDGAIVKGQIGKLMLLPHLDALVTGRGALPFISALFTALTGLPLGFDGIGAEACGICDAVFKNVARFVDMPPEAEPNSVVIVGWSEAKARFMLIELEQQTRAGGFRRAQDSRFFIAPWDRSIDGLSHPKSAGDFVALGIAQRNLLRAKCGPDVAAGGALVFAELRRGAAMTRIAHRFDDDAQARGAA